VTDTSARLLGHKDAHAVELGQSLDACRDVHRIPDGGVLATARRADVANHNGSRVNTDTHAKRRVATLRPFSVEAGKLDLHREAQETARSA